MNERRNDDAEERKGVGGEEIKSRRRQGGIKQIIKQKVTQYSVWN
jgi:hypothetical protein